MCESATTNLERARAQQEHQLQNAYTRTRKRTRAKKPGINGAVVVVAVMETELYYDDGVDKERERERENRKKDAF